MPIAHAFGFALHGSIAAPFASSLNRTSYEQANLSETRIAARKSAQQALNTPEGIIFTSRSGRRVTQVFFRCHGTLVNQLKVTS
jgi:hypothetical protein